MNSCEPPAGWIMAATILPVLVVSIQFCWGVGNAKPLAMVVIGVLGSVLLWWLNRPAPRT